MHLKVSIPFGAVQAPLPATAQLGLLKDAPFSNAQLGLRHPWGIYNISMQSVVRAFADAFDAAANYRKDSDTAHEFTRAIDHLLDATVEHFDDLRSIVRIVYEAQGEAIWKMKLRHFDDTVRQARDFSAVQTNEIKHKQARIQLVHIMTGETIVFIGYFVDGVDTNGAVGPNQSVHAGATAFSLCRAFRFLACSLYFASRVLATVLPSRRNEGQNTPGLGAYWPVFERLLEFDNYGTSEQVSRLLSASPLVATRLMRT